MGRRSLLASTRPQIAKPMKARLPRKEISGCFTSLMVVEGERKRAMLRSIWPKKTPVAKPKTLTILNNGM